MLSVLIVLGALVLLMTVAYRGFSVILFAPVAALLAVLFTDPTAVPAAFTGLFMDKLVLFLKSYLPVFLLGAVFGKLIELSGFASAIVRAVIALIGRQRAIPAIVAVCALLTYGGVSLFVVVFAVFPFAAEMFRQGSIPKRLIPGTIVLGAFSFTMDALPGTPQIQNLIPTTFFGTDGWAAPWLGVIGSVVIVTAGLVYLDHRRQQALAAGEGYGAGLCEDAGDQPPPLVAQTHPLVALLPLIVVGVANRALTSAIPRWFGTVDEVHLDGLTQPLAVQVQPVVALWAVEGALLLGIACVLGLAFRAVASRFAEGTKQAVSGALLAAMNTASEYGFGAVIAALPGFVAIREALKAVPDPLLNVAVGVSTLAGVTGSASGGMSIALAAMAERFLASAHAVGIPPEVLHRVAAMASGGMDTLPHNGAVITLLTVTGLTHRQSYREIFAITCIKTIAVVVVIVVYRLTGLV